MRVVTRLLTAALILFLIHKPGHSQAFLNQINPETYNGNLVMLAKQIDQFYDTASGSNLSGYKQWKRWEWFAMQHVDVQGVMGNYLVSNAEAIKAMDKLAAAPGRSHTGDWSNIGHASAPGEMARQGRVNSVAFDPVNAAILYVATAGGGMWKSYNSGDSWINLTIDLPVLGIADIIVSPAPNNHILYALTGDLSGGANVYTHNSLGVLKSYDSGLTWARTNFIVPPALDLRGYKLLMAPNNPNLLLAAMSDGIHITRDGGLTWALTGAMGNVNDMEFSISNPDTVYFATRNSNNFSKLSLTTNVVRNIPINTSRAVDRMEIAVTPDNPAAVYVLAGPGYNFFGGNLFNGLFYSNNNGSSFTVRSVLCSNNDDLFNSVASISWYANTLYVDPQEENYVIVGGLNLFNSVDGGVTLNQVTVNSVHADQHNIKRNPLNGHLWLCNDGGLYRSTNSGNVWENKSNGLTINEYYRISGTDNMTDRLIGGTQDNGHFLRQAPGSFQYVLGGDGMDNFFNSYDNSIVYACSQNGGLARSTNFGQNFSGTTLPNSGDEDFYPWITPIVQFPPVFDGNQWQNTDVIYVYSLDGIMRGINGNSWVNIGPAGIGQIGTGPSMTVASDVFDNSNLYISNGNKFWVCTNPMASNPTWLNLSPPIGSSTFISAIAVNPGARTEVWIAISGYQNGVKVYRTLNAGFSWSNVSLSLPNVPMYSVAFANNQNNPPGAVFVGTEIGVFYKDDFTPDWVPFSNGLPHVPITDLQVNYVTRELKAATYGRGIWRSDLYESCPSLVLVDFNINQGQYDFESSDVIRANKYIEGGVGARVRMKAANQIVLLPGFRIFPESNVRIAIGTCGSGISGLNQAPANAGLSDQTKW